MVNAKVRRLYGVWGDMKQRCKNPKHHSYHRYGGRGITVCEEWQRFQPFYDWAMSLGYDPRAPRGAYTVDRIDNNKGYSPENCRLVTMAEQAYNRRNNIKIWGENGYGGKANVHHESNRQ